jgi:hypothetical protein
MKAIGGEAEGGRCGAGSGHQLVVPARDARAGANPGGKRNAAGNSMRQRPGVHESSFPGLVHGSEDRVGAQSTGRADAERTSGRF